MDVIKVKFQTDEAIDEHESFQFTMPSSRKLHDSKWRPDKIVIPIVDQQKRDAQQFYLEPIDAQKIGWFSI